MQMKEKSSSGVFSTGGDLAVDETLNPPALQMPNGKGQRKEAPGGGWAEGTNAVPCWEMHQGKRNQSATGALERKRNKNLLGAHVCSCGWAHGCNGSCTAEQHSVLGVRWFSKVLGCCLRVKGVLSFPCFSWVDSMDCCGGTQDLQTPLDLPPPSTGPFPAVGTSPSGWGDLPCFYSS